MSNRFHSVVVGCIVFALAVLLTARSLHSGFSTDDHFARAVFRGFTNIPEYARADRNAFLFSDGDPEKNLALMDRGVFPWWSVPTARLAFWRPLASWTHYLDYRLWGRNPFPMHLENVLLYALLCVLASILYRRFMEPPWVAGFAALLFTIDENNGHAVGWIANRNMLMAACCVVVILLVHDAWRRGGWKAGAILGPVVLAFGFLCAEAVIAAGAYLLAYALFLDKGRWLRRFLTLVPYGIVVVVWNLFYRMSGYGSAGSGWYTDPATDPFGFLKALVTHVPILVADLFVMWPAPLLNRFNAALFPYIVALLAVVVLGMLWVLKPLLKRDAVSRFWLFGMVLALAPVSAVTPQPRVVLLAGIGCAPLIARYLSGWATREQWTGFAVGLAILGTVAYVVGLPTLTFYSQAALILGTLIVLGFLLYRADKHGEWMPSRRSWRVAGAGLAYLWVIFHVVVAPIAMPGSSMLLGVTSKKMEQAYASIPSEPQVTNDTVVILQAKTDFMPWHFALIRGSLDIPYPGHVRVLSAGNRQVTVERPDDNTLILRAQPNLIGNPSTSVFRSGNDPMRPGDEIKLSGATVRVLEVDGFGLPSAARYRFDAPLDDTSFVWLTVASIPYELKNIGRYIHIEYYVTVDLPGVGESLPLDTLVERSEEYRELVDGGDRDAEPARGS